ncbi:hypothetical protein KM043_008040 [Ampulex compressa]|nr:hypothetical protein KM043_008040 [Ampulex compressa]
MRTDNITSKDMSTRWYPFYQKGNPQLRVFLPNFWLKLVKPTHQQPKNVVQFHCSMEMTKYDIKNYLEKIYGVNVVDIRTRIALGKTRLAHGQKYVVKDDDIKVAYAILPKEESFIFPDFFKEEQDSDEQRDLKKLQEKYSTKTQDKRGPGLSNWF